MSTPNEIEWARRALDEALRGRLAGSAMDLADALRTLRHSDAGAIDIRWSPTEPIAPSPPPPAAPGRCDRDHPLWDRWLDG